LVQAQAYVLAGYLPSLVALESWASHRVKLMALAEFFLAVSHAHQQHFAGCRLLSEQLLFPAQRGYLNQHHHWNESQVESATCRLHLAQQQL
jgi:hypothetical protein